ncbi:MAG: DNA repair protein RecN [Bacilli bacterium]|nr:DNA repair protein RecN [Bacilli bacterium]
MFLHLSVKNFAIIEDAEISFRDGLTVLTGETGAGKSLIIDSINLLLGDRANSELIRNGEEKAIIVGTFSFQNKRLEAYLDKLDIEHPNNTIEVSRTISSTKNVIKVNNKVVSLSELKGISKYLADIHQQFDMVKLLNKENYLDIVDGFKYELIEEYKAKYHEALANLKAEEKKYHELEEHIQDIKDKREQYEYELKELKALHLEEGELESINSEIALLKNYDKIYALLAESKELIDKDGLADIYEIKNNIEKVNEYQNEYQEVVDKLNNYYYELSDVYETISKKFSHLDYDPKRLIELEDRKQDLTLMEKKYHKNIEDLLKYQLNLEDLLKNDEDLDIALNEEKENLKAQYNNTYKLALDLSTLRKEISKNIEIELMNNLNDLGLKNRFEIVFNVSEIKEDLSTSIFLESGIDDIDFYIETNVGEGLKPLAKIASGGEISRIMLAIKALFIKSQKISTVIFDEIDTGISGEIARKVALKIRDISLSSQVIIITHLPQVASLSNNHIKISKEVVKGRTYTSIKELNLEEKIYEIALMISGGKVTPSQLEYAKEMVINKD